MLIDYDRKQPLIVIHIPKAAGRSSQKFFQEWYGEGFLRHYFNEETGQMPKKHDLFGLHSVDKPIVLHGHFNKLRGFGVENYYPDVKQFITILRDPYELTISSYFFTRKSGSNWKDKSRIPTEQEIEKYLINAKPNMLNHFPKEITSHNYREIIDEYFIEIGITERLRDSMKWIAHKLGMLYNDSILGHHNATERDQEIPDHLKELYIENNQLEFEVYNYALEKFTQQGAAPDSNSTSLHCHR